MDRNLFRNPWIRSVHFAAMVEEAGVDVDIEVDGGIYQANVKEVLDAGANIIVSGSGVFKGDIAKNTREFMEILNSHE